jgi:cation diffusion facilitator CzcD-associated flavoprotein CzcO
MEHVDVIIVGAGQAGLAVSHELSAAGIEHVVLERGRIGQTWRQRWDSFCLVTPNWTVKLPGFPYKGPDPDGFMPRDEIVGILEDYARSFRAPVREDVTVSAAESPPTGGFILTTTLGELRGRVLVLATGSYHRAHRPAAADTLPPGLLKMDLYAYRNERALPAGSVLVVGSGQSGAQISEELREAGREVVLSCGKAPWVPRRIGNRDIVWWLTEAGFFDQSIEALPTPAARLGSNPLVSGHGGGRDLNLRTLRAKGVTLAGRFLGAQDGIARFAPDLGENVAWGDQRYRELMGVIEGRAAEMGVSLQIDEPESFDAEAPESVDLSRFGFVLFTTGFRPDYRSWLPWPNAFDDLGFPLQKDGASVILPGLCFAGVHFLRTRKSALLLGVGEDAGIIARHIALDLARSGPHT